jgi:hypothetical protein
MLSIFCIPFVFRSMICLRLHRLFPLSWSFSYLVASENDNNDLLVCDYCSVSFLFRFYTCCMSCYLSFPTYSYFRSIYIVLISGAFDNEVNVNIIH